MNLALTLIEIPQVGSATAIEIIWTVAGIIVFILSVWNLIGVLNDLVAASYATAQGEHGVIILMLAWGYTRRELIRVFQCIIIIVIGLLACLTPSPALVATRITIVGLILTIGLVLISLLIGLQSFLDLRQRQHIASLINSKGD